MLARTFKTADELTILPKEHAALVDVLGRLERGKLKHSHRKNIYMILPPVQPRFNMSAYGISPHDGSLCGTTCCIAGWCDYLHGTDFTRRSFCYGRSGDRLPLALDDLFLIRGASALVLDDVTVSQAAVALRNYLETGSARWNEVLDMEW